MATTTLRLASTTSWEGMLVGGASFHAVTSDDSDASYARVEGSLLIDATARLTPVVSDQWSITSVKFRFRAAGTNNPPTGGDGVVQLSVFFRDDADVEFALGEQTTASGASIHNATSDEVVSLGTNAEWQNFLAAGSLRIGVLPPSFGVTTFNANLYEFFVDVVYDVVGSWGAIPLGF